MQSNQNIINKECEFHIIDNDIWEVLLEKLFKKENIHTLKSYVHIISIQYNIDKKNIIKDFLNYIIRNHKQYLCKDILDFFENLMHTKIQNNNIYIYYSLSRLSTLLSK
jgi:F0F1-type ATP synthase delta subunit